LISEEVERNLCRILVVDDEPSVMTGCVKILESAGYNAEGVGNGMSLMEKAKNFSFDVVLLDMKLPDRDGIELLSEFKKMDPRPYVIMMTAYPTVSTAVEAMKRGAFDYIPKPFSPEQLLMHVDRAARARIEEDKKEDYRKRILHKEEETFIVANSPQMKEVMNLAQKVADTDATVLITGESGTGKEVLAERIHALSHRKDKEFVAVDCSAIADGVVESELFGHAKGAFTGAWSMHRGSFEIASGGTLFLDEVGNLNLSTQSKLLRVIQEKEIKRVGEARPIKIDVRIISATNRDLEKEVEKGNFREDLLFRLNVFPIKIPPLRERKEDIIPLATGFLRIFCKKHGKNIIGFEKKVEEFMLGYNWPGNIRELKNLVERGVIVEERGILTKSSVVVGDNAIEKVTKEIDKSISSLEEMEREHILNVLEKTGWNKKKSAKILKIDPKTLYAKIKKYNFSSSKKPK